MLDRDSEEVYVDVRPPVQALQGIAVLCCRTAAVCKL